MGQQQSINMATMLPADDDEAIGGDDFAAPAASALHQSMPAITTDE